MTFVAYALYAAAMFAAFALVDPRRAVWPAFFIGFAWLPPVLEPGSWPASEWLVTGGALPTPYALSKALIVPLVALAGALAFDRRRPRFRPHIADGAIAAFCLWPLLQSFLIGDGALPAGWISAAYLSGTWGTLWLLGRLYLRNREDLRAFSRSLVVVTLTLLPLALLETLIPLRVHEAFIGPHPFAHTGQTRWLGSRPLLLFEDGNQYGIWVASAALAAAWLWRSKGGLPAAAIATILILAALASQSWGAITLLVAALAALFFPRLRRIGVLAAPAIVSVGLVLGALHLGGVVNFRDLVLGHPVGDTIYGGLRDIGRGSLFWRFGQDIKTFPEIRDQMLLGTGQWDWFASAGTRPWGLPQLLLGQFGIVALILLALAGLAATARCMRADARIGSLILLPALIVAMAAIDALLNSFLFYPAISLAAATVAIGRTPASRNGRKAPVRGSEPARAPGAYSESWGAGAFAGAVPGAAGDGVPEASGEGGAKPS